MDYCNKTGITDETQIADMEHHIAAMDSAYISWVNEKRKGGK